MRNDLYCMASDLLDYGSNLDDEMMCIFDLLAKKWRGKDIDLFLDDAISFAKMTSGC